MNNPHWFSRPNSIRLTLRIALGSALAVSALGMAFVAAKTSSPPPVAKSDQQVPKINKFRMDRDQLLGNKVTRPGTENELGPLQAALDDLAKRAYPADD